MRNRCSWALMAILSLAAVPPARAEVSSPTDQRLTRYGLEAIDFSAIGSESYVVKRGGQVISDLEVASASGNPEFVTEVQRAALLSHSYKAVAGTLAVPLGIVLAIDNFFGKDRAAKLGELQLPAPILAPFPATSPWSFALSAGGTALALYGAYQLGELLAEGLGRYQPRYLDQGTVQATTKRFNADLAASLGLEASATAQVKLGQPATASPVVFPLAFPEGATGSGTWAIRAAIPIATRQDPHYRPFMAYSRDFDDLTTGLINRGAWHVVFSTAPVPPAPDASDSLEPTPPDAVLALPDLDVAVPRYGGGPTWNPAGRGWATWREGTGLLDQVRVDSPAACTLMKEAYRDLQVGWLAPNDIVALLPFQDRLHHPLWTVFRSDLRLPPTVGVDARSGNLVDLSRFK